MVENKPDAVEKALATLKPALSKLTFGGFMGFCSGYASKKLGKAIAFTIGLAFLGLQGMVATGYISIDWMKVKDDAIKAADTDGDGQLTVDDAKEYWRRLRVVLTNKLPDAGGFSIGFLYGVKSG